MVARGLVVAPCTRQFQTSRRQSAHSIHVSTATQPGRSTEHIGVIAEFGKNRTPVWKRGITHYFRGPGEAWVYCQHDPCAQVKRVLQVIDPDIEIT